MLLFLQGKKDGNELSLTKEYNFLLGRIYFTGGNDGYQLFLAFSPMDNSKKVTNWILTRVSSKKIKPLYTNLALIMSDLANGRVNLKFNDSVLMQKNSSLYCNFILNLYIVYELNNWPCNPSNNFAQQNCLFGAIKLTRNAIKRKFIYNGREIAFDEKG